MKRLLLVALLALLAAPAFAEEPAVKTAGKTAEGVVFSYSLQAKLAPIDPERSKKEGEWTPPFQVGDRRVARLAGQRRPHRAASVQPRPTQPTAR